MSDRKLGHGTIMPNPNRVFPNGTKVVLKEDCAHTSDHLLRQGSVGTVEGYCDDIDMHRVSLPNHGSFMIPRRILAAQRESLRMSIVQAEVTPDYIRDHSLFCCLAGSRAYGMNEEDSDWDYRGIFAYPSEHFWGVYQYQDEKEWKCDRPPTTPKIVVVQPIDAECKFFEIGKVIRLALAGNPNVVELGLMPAIFGGGPHPAFDPFLKRWEELFVSIRVFSAYQGYAIGQLKKLRADLSQRGEIRWKHAAHLIRLLHSGTHCLKTGHIMVQPGGSVLPMLRLMRQGQIMQSSFEEVCRIYEDEFEAAFREAREKKLLPPDGKKDEAQRLLVVLRQQLYEEGWQ